jgi:hypothetical protein
MKIVHVCRDRREPDWGDGRPTLERILKRGHLLLFACTLNLFFHCTVYIYIVAPLFFLLAAIINLFNKLTRRRDFRATNDVHVGWVLRRFKIDEMRLPCATDFAVVHEWWVDRYKCGC